eukprot:jgi/Tetstr1/449432/TSEL_036527.t1
MAGEQRGDAAAPPAAGPAIRLKLQLDGTQQVRHLAVAPSEAGFHAVLAAARRRFAPFALADCLQVEDLAVGGAPTGTPLKLSAASLSAGAFDPLAVQLLAGQPRGEPLQLRVFPAPAAEEGEWDMMRLELADIAGLHQPALTGPPDSAGVTPEEAAGKGEEEEEEEEEYASELLFWINGKEHRVTNPRPATTLADYLHSVGLTGTKVACGEGGCGCCTVTLSVPAPDGSTAVTPINSCLRLLPAVDGCAITTTEGIGSQADGFHPIQAAIADGNGSQCGYCTPGFVMSMYGLLESAGPDGPSPAEVEQHLDGHLCRCTGYRPILDSFKGMGACRHEGVPPPPGDIEECGSSPTCSRDGLPCAKYCRSPPLPPTVAALQAVKRPLHFTDAESGTEWFRPVSLRGLTRLLARLAAAGKAPRLVCANTSMGVEKYYAGGAADVYAWDAATATAAAGSLVEVKDVPELLAVDATPQGGLTLGAAVPMSGVIQALEAADADQRPTSTAAAGVGERYLPYQVLARHLRRVANVQVRNCGSWAGNLMLARAHPGFPSDLATILAAAGASLSVVADPSGDCAEAVSMTVEELLALRPADGATPLLVAMEVPPLPVAPAEGQRRVFSTFKTGARHVNAAAIVNAGFDCVLDTSTGAAVAVTAVFNGLAPALLRASRVEQALLGQPLSQGTLSAAVAALDADIAAAGGPSDDAHSSPTHRLALARSYLYKLFLEAQPQLPAHLASALRPFVAAEDRPLSSGTQTYGAGDPALYPVSEAIPKLGSRLQASGEAAYASSMASGRHGCLVYSTAAAARLLALDPSPALALPGVLEFVGPADIPGVNALCSPAEPLFFATGQRVPCVGAPLGLVVATSKAAARAGAKAPIAASLEEAIRQHRIPPKETTDAALAALVAQRGQMAARMPSLATDPEPLELRCGNPAGVIAARRRTAQAANGGGTLTGKLHTGAQKHFYMEPHVTLASPQEDGCIELWSGTQDPCLTQQVLSALLAKPQHSITVKVRRNGGGFGGKISRHMAVAAAAAVAATKLRAPVLVQNERLDDLVMTGGREEMIAHCRATWDGTPGESSGSLAMAVAFSDNAYHTPHYEVVGQPYLSDIHPNAATRAPGVVQSILAHEVVIEHVAKTVGLPMEVVQERNFYRAGQKTPAGVVIGSATHNWLLPEMWTRMKTDADFAARKAAVADFNAGNRWRKRGISIAPVRYGISTGFYKSGALVNIYADGTVLVAHGGCEVGQGISTKAAQAAAHELGIPIKHVKVSDTDTSK